MEEKVEGCSIPSQNIRIVTLEENRRRRRNALAVNNLEGIFQFVQFFGGTLPANNPILETILQRSMSDSTLRRDENIVLDYPLKSAEQKDAETSCSVCQAEIRQGERIPTLICGHIFHDSCLQEWGKHRQTCPVCRVEIPFTNLSDFF